MDSCVEDVLDKEVQSRVEDAVRDYLQNSKKILNEKISILQEELRKYGATGEANTFREEIKKACLEIQNTEFPQVAGPRPDIDLDYNDDYRFYSRSECEKAARNRRERAYNEGCAYIRNLPEELNNAYMEQLGKLLTQWKRAILRAYDMSNKERPTEPLKIAVGSISMAISLTDFDDVETPRDTEIGNYVSKHIIGYGTSVGDVSYMSSISCKIEIWEDYDIKETIFGNIKEVNHRYGYTLPLYEFQNSADNVATACNEALAHSEFFLRYFSNLKNSMLQALAAITR